MYYFDSSINLDEDPPLIFTTSRENKRKS